MITKKVKWKIPIEALEQMKREGWATIEQQKAYWAQRDTNLDKIESCCQFHDEKDKEMPF